MLLLKYDDCSRWSYLWSVWCSDQLARMNPFLSLFLVTMMSDSWRFESLNLKYKTPNFKTSKTSKLPKVQKSKSPKVQKSKSPKFQNSKIQSIDRIPGIPLWISKKQYFQYISTIFLLWEKSEESCLYHHILYYLMMIMIYDYIHESLELLTINF